MKTSLVLAVAVCALAPALRAETLTGTVELTGTPPVMQRLKREADPVCGKVQMNDESVLLKDKKLANVWVHVVAGAPDAAPPADQVTIDQKDCMYRPRIVTAVVGQTVLAKTSDPTLHNVHARLGTETVFNKGMPNQNSKPVEYKADRPGVVSLKCDVHPWMRGFIGVNKNGYQAISGEGGEFKIDGLAPGKYTLEAWHEKFGVKTQDVTIEKGKAASVKFTFDSSDKPAQ
ncbi:MAG: TonB-dependent receptor [Deltaproteobacteria bacterium]|nr:TonB-dependent receptor [Deltaproteobacteria bacterium]